LRPATHDSGGRRFDIIVGNDPAHTRAVNFSILCQHLRRGLEGQKERPLVIVDHVAAALAHAKDPSDDAAHRRLMLRKLFAWAGSLACDDRVADVVLCAGQPAASASAWRARPPTDAEFRGSLSGWIQ